MNGCGLVGRFLSSQARWWGVPTGRMEDIEEGVGARKMEMMGWIPVRQIVSMISPLKKSRRMDLSCIGVV